MVVITEKMIRNKEVPELLGKTKISVDQANQLTTYLNSNENEFEYGYLTWFQANQFIHLTYRKAASVIADNNGFQNYYLMHIILALYPNKYKHV